MQYNGDNIRFGNLDELTAILGTVSEDGSGNSNGAIFESGENANGSYVKFANGWMICTAPVRSTGDITTLTSGVYLSALLGPFTQPAVFTGAVSSFASCNSEVVWFGVLGGNTLYVKAFCPVARTAATSYNVTSIGKWK